MHISIITLFPEVFDKYLNSSILKRAQNKAKVSFELINLRDFGEGVHKLVDDKSFGGGVGMVLRADILSKALKSINKIGKKRLVILTSASGEIYNQNKVKKLIKYDHLIIICGHYEGVDQRFIDKYVDLEISIGEYVLTGGELPAMIITDSITRLIPGVLEKVEAINEESFENNLLEYPHYTRPQEFEDLKVPEVLLSGNHELIKQWRHKESKIKTKLRKAS